jgi:hypothetical protein
MSSQKTGDHQPELLSNVEGNLTVTLNDLDINLKGNRS